MNSKLASIARIAVILTAGSAAGAQTTPASSLLENPLLKQPTATTAAAHVAESKSVSSKASPSKPSAMKANKTKPSTVTTSGETHTHSSKPVDAHPAHATAAKSEVKAEAKEESKSSNSDSASDAKSESKSQSAAKDEEKASEAAAASIDDGKGSEKPVVAEKSSTKADTATLTKADPPGSLQYGAVQTRESAMSAIGDGGRMIYTLFPMLIMLVGGMRLLANYHKKHGRLPGPLNSMAQRSRNGAPMAAAAAPQAGFKANALAGLASGISKGFAVRKDANAPQSAIRLVETMSLGGANVHLVEVNGRSLLLGATGTNVSLLTEFEEEDDDARFNVLLEEANVQMQGVAGRSSDKAELLRAGMLRNDLSSATSSVESATRRLQALRGY